MTDFDVSEYVTPTRTDPNNGIIGIVSWLNDNVGKWDNCIYPNSSNVVSSGAGWSIRTRRNGKEVDDDNPSGYAVVTWHTHIDDDQKATMFALKWIK